MIYLVSILVLLFFVFLKIKKNKELQVPVFSKKWRALLIANIQYYTRLSEENKRLFEQRILLFLNDKKITGVDVTVDDLTKLMVASAAVIPAFAFEGYNYPNIREVLLYSQTFDDHFLYPNEPIKHKHIEGMVGEGILRQVVMLTKVDLLAGFSQNQPDNVGIHEFTHLIDKSDGVTDGVPSLLVNKSFVLPWLKEMHNEMQKIKTGTSDISPYAITNEAEFLAVASEYFFSSPDTFKEKHPALFSYLQQIFHQDLV